MLRSFYYVVGTSMVAVCLLLTIAAFAAEQQRADATKTEAPAAPPPPTEIALADIAARATDVAKLLDSLTSATAPDPQVENIAKSLADLSAALSEQAAATQTTLETEPTLETLQALVQQWQRRQLDTTAWLNTLTQHATKLQDGLKQLADQQQLWNSTKKSAEASKAPDPILQQIDATLTAIIVTQGKIQGEREVILDLQSRVAQEVTKCTAALTALNRFQQKAVAGIFVPDAPPLWRVDLWAGAFGALPEHVRNVQHARWSEFAKYVREPREGSALHAIFFIVLALIFRAARSKIAFWQKSGVAISEPLFVFARPYSAALASALLIATSPFFQLSNPVRQIMTLTALVPMLRLLKPTASPAIVAALYTAGGLFAIENVRQAYGGIQVIGQAILVAETLAALVAMFSLRRHYRQILAERAESSYLILLRAAHSLIIVVLVFSLLGGAAGYVRLARLLTPGILVGGVLALAAYAYLRVVGGVIALAFRVWPLRLLKIVEVHGEQLERSIYRFLIWMAVIGWTTRYLAYLGLLDTVLSLAGAVLTSKIERGTLSISVGSIIEFLLVVYAAYLLSRFLRFVLQEDVYPRIDLAPGMSYAVSSLLNYIILALGFVAGLGVLGVDFSKVSVMAGAFGVGIGFGLQSIVNNFVSGLILLFERPMHLGDTVEVGNLQGTVRRIGIRASVIRTGAGADIIVPNSQLITDRVTNWTLSDRLRRVDLPVGVNYGADPKIVIEVLERTALAHADVLRDPAPRALFIGYGENSINFELRVWPKNFNQAAQVRSDLASAVYHAVISAGMSFPFPQREVRILSDPTSESAPTLGSAGIRKD